MANPSRIGQCCGRTFTLAAILALVFFNLSTSALAAPPVENTQCILGQAGAPNGLNCTSNDVSLSSPIVTVVEPCGFPGDTATLQVLVDVTLNAQTRYDIGVWVSVDGDPNMDGSESGICSVVTIPNNILDVDGTSVDLDGDQCGDVDSTAAGPPDIVQADLGTFDVLCNDTDGDGNINVPLIIAWDNQDANVCTVSTDSVPNTPAKCRAEPDGNLPVPVPARLIVNKSTAGGDPESFEFTLSGPAPGDPAPGGWDGTNLVFNLSDGGSWDSGMEVPGGMPAGDDYAVTETPEAGWVSMGSCSSDLDGLNTDPANLDLRAGETVTCNFTNTPDTASLTIRKQSNGGTDTFNFNGTGSIGAFALDTGANNPAEQVFMLSAGSYDVTETIPAGWTLTSAACVPATGTTDLNAGSITGIMLAGGDDVVCTFTDAADGVVTVTKLTQGGDATFGFTSDFPDAGADDFDITTTAGSGSEPGGFMPQPGDYNITEDTIPAGWAFVSAECRDQGNQVVSTPNGNGVDLTVGDGDTINCVFNNLALGTIIVEKVTDPSGAPDSFTFSGDAAGSISHGGQIMVSGLMPGNYSSTETVPAGWDLTDISCDDGDSSGDVGTATANFVVAAGETVTCTFTNTQLASIIVEKQIQGDPGGADTEFDFASSFSAPFMLDPVNTPASMQFDDLAPGGGYSVAEDVPTDEGWALVSASCGAGETVNLATGVISEITLAPGDTVTCTFVNELMPPEIALVKDVQGGGPAAPEDFTLILTGNDGTHNGGVNYVSGAVVVVQPGTAYTLTEVADPDYTDGGVECVDDLSQTVVAHPVTLTGSQTVTCTQTNIFNEPPPPPPPPQPMVPIPVNHPLALILLTLMVLAAGWYFRPSRVNRF